VKQLPVTSFSPRGNAGTDGKFPIFLVLEIGVSPVCPRFIPVYLSPVYLLLED